MHMPTEEPQVPQPSLLKERVKAGFSLVSSKVEDGKEKFNEISHKRKAVACGVVAMGTVASITTAVGFVF